MKKIILCTIILLAFSARCVLAAGPEVSTDEFLEYTLKDLRDKMDAALDSNNQLSAKNASIRKRVMMLQKSLRDMGKEKISLQEDISVIRNYIKLEAKELDVHKKRLDALSEQKRNMSYQVDSLRKNVETQQLDQGLLTGSVEDLEAELKGLQARAQGDQKSVLLQYYSEQREAFVDMLKEARARLRNKESQRDLLEVELSDSRRSHEREYHKQEQLKERLSSLHLLVEEKNAEAGLLHHNQDRLRNGVYEEKGRLQEDIDGLKQIAKQMKLAKQDVESKRATVNQDFRLHEKALRSFQDLLMQENEYLFQKKVLLQEAKELVRETNESGHNGILIQASLDEIKGKAEEIKKVNRGIEDKLAAEKQEQEILEVNYGRLEKEVKALEDDLARQAQEMKKKREDMFGKKKSEVQAMLNDKNTQLETRMKEQAGIEEAINKATKELTDARAVNEDRKREMNRLEAALKNLAEKKDLFSKQKAEFSQEIQNNEKKISTDIEALKIRKKALKGSLGVVQKKYDASQLTVEGFASEEEELKEYLQVITRENLSLQKKKQALEARL